MAAYKKWSALFILSLLCISACAEWRVEEPQIAMLPTLTPSATISPTPAIAPSATPITPTFTPTVTLTPRYSPTPLLGSTSTPSDYDLTMTALGPAAAQSPLIEYFVAFPTEVEPGETVLLFWASSKGTSAAIYRLNDDGSPGRTWQVELEGSLPVTPRVTGRNEIYVLAVTNGIVTVERRAVVSVTCPYTWFFEPPAEGCPDSVPAATQAIVQAFERGRMIWRSDTAQIIVLFNDIPDPNNPPPAWLVMPDPYLPGEPENDPNIVPPDGLQQPQRGFGKLWREVPGLRDRIGWAIGSEVPFTMTFQYETLSSGQRLYFSDETGTAILLDIDGTGWTVVGYQ